MISQVEVEEPVCEEKIIKPVGDQAEDDIKEKTTERPLTATLRPEDVKTDKIKTSGKFESRTLLFFEG